MTLADLQVELQARGFDYLSTTRQNYYINSAYQIDICEDSDWPFLEVTTTGTAPLTITDLRSIESVIDTTQACKLRPLDRRSITDDYDTSLTTAGSPSFYYLTTATTVSVYPANTTDTLSVRYWKFPAALSAASDTPVVPTRFHPLIVDAAVVAPMRTTTSLTLRLSGPGSVPGPA